ncbi:class I SAM-dependent methyltransferase [Yoonia sp. 67]|uniref:class I SAM-dependent methyltransferase n=1 Tax=Yoonia sp. 67 TaxID=3081449 RepID=UPI002AFE4D41|nr:class I SAM-dependent methyltransferase [Yoonia sp. 67]
MPMNLTPKQAQQFQELRGKWYEVIKPLDGYSPSNFLEPIPYFLPEHLENCRVLPRREMVIQDIPKGSVIAEVGTQQGNFAKKIYDNCAPKELHLLDIDFAPFHAKGHFVPMPDNVLLHEGDSSTKLSSFDNEYFDVIYIDGDHSYAGARRDAEVAVRKLKRDGMLWFNDFTIWSPAEMEDYGVPYVISELCHSGEWEMTILTLDPLFYNDVVLRRRNDK